MGNNKGVNMSHNDSTDRTAYIALGMIFGAALGVAAGVLTAPRSGMETRTQLKGRAMDAKSKAQGQLMTGRDKAAEKLSKTLEKSKGTVDTAADKAKSMADRTSARAKRAADQAKAEVDDRSGNSAS